MMMIKGVAMMCIVMMRFFRMIFVALIDGSSGEVISKQDFSEKQDHCALLRIYSSHA